jgi:hypothetical protein
MLRAQSPGRTLSLRSGGGDLAREIAGLSTLDATALKQLWVALGGAAPPPELDRPLLIRALAYRLQERALGGLKPATRRFLLQVCEDAESQRTGPVRPARAAQPGMVLVREWHGTSHRVTVLETACCWRGRRYRSLSAVARAITGTRWSGPRFFGLGRPRERRATHGQGSA